MNIQYLLRYLCVFFICLNIQAKHLEMDFYFQNIRTDRPPVAVLSSDQVVDVDAVVKVLGASSFDPEGEALSYRWSFDVLPMGAKAQINNPTSENISFVPDIPGAYIVKLIVYDSTQRSRPAYISIRIRESNIPPIAGRVLYQQKNKEGLPILFKIGIEGQSDSDGEIVAYEWDFGDGNISYITVEENIFVKTLFHYYRAVGTYPVRITSIDNRGARSTATRNITIRDNQLPRPVFSVSVVPNTSNPSNYDIRLNASSSSDPDGTITRYKWEIIGPSSEYEYEGTSVTQTHTVSSGEEGVYKIRLIVDDNDRAYNDTIANIYVGIDAPPGGSAPVHVILARPTVGTAPLTVNFDASNSFDLEGDNFKAYWHFGDHSAAELGQEGLTSSYTFKRPGKYSVDLLLVDSHGNREEKSISVHVRPSDWSVEQRPGPQFFALQNDMPRSARFTHDEHFDLHQIPNENYFWDFGDASKARGNNKIHQYDEEGTYLVTLTTIDGDGVRRKITKAITVRNDGGFPTLNFSDDRSFPINRESSFDSFDASSTTGGSLKFFHSFGDGTPFVSSVTGDSVSHAFRTQGSYEVFLYAEEEGRASIDHIVVFPYLGVAPHPRFSMSSRVGVAPLTVNFNGSYSSDDGSITSYYWYFGEDRFLYPDQYAVGSSASHTYHQVGEEHARLAVVDNMGNISVRHEKIIILESANPNNQSPTASFVVNISGLEVDFSGDSSNDPDGEIKFYDWDFGDEAVGVSGEGDSDYLHFFMEGGSYQVTLRVTDNDGGIHQVTKAVTVSEELL